MSTAVIDPLEAVIRDAGEDWLIDWYAPNSAALPHLRQRLAAADAQAHQRFGTAAPRLTAEELVEQYKNNPHKVRAFLQVLKSLSPEMLVMVWRVLQGAGVRAIRMEYEAETAFSLRVRLISPDDSRMTEEYSSNEIADAAVLRHLGTTKVSGRALFDGFYALNLR